MGDAVQKQQVAQLPIAPPNLQASAWSTRQKPRLDNLKFEDPNFWNITDLCEKKLPEMKIAPSLGSTRECQQSSTGSGAEVRSKFDDPHRQIPQEAESLTMHYVPALRGKFPGTTDTELSHRFVKLNAPVAQSASTAQRKLADYRRDGFYDMTCAPADDDHEPQHSMRQSLAGIAIPASTTVQPCDRGETK